MVISFSVQEARDQLLKKGEVFTYRWTPRKKIGKDWANVKRGSPRIADVFIEDYGERSLSEFTLGPFADKSGFKDVNAWIRKILEMANPHGYMTGHLYKVHLLNRKVE